MNTVGYFEIHSSNTKREIKFYEAVFSWKFIKEEYVPIEYYRIETNSINGGLLLRPEKKSTLETEINSYVCSIQVENFDITRGLILQNGGLITLPKFAIAGKCWQGYFKDLDNNTFGIFEVDENAQ